MTTEHYLVIGLVAIAAWLNRSTIGQALAGAQAQAPPQPQAPAVRILPPEAAQLPTTAALLGLVHHQTEAEALAKMHEDTAAAIISAKAALKLGGLPWAGLATQSPGNPVPKP